MIGTSLPLGVLTDSPVCEADKCLLDSYGGCKNLLAAFRKMGVESVELRSVRTDTAGALLAKCVSAVLGSGLNVTIHATLADVSAEAFFKSLSPATKLLPEGHPVVPLTLHSAKSGDELRDRAATIRILKRWGRYALDRNLPVIFALENNRIHSSGLSIVDCDGVISTVREVGLENVGTCFDFGHLYSNFTSYPECTPFLPSEPFVQAAVHTHIHGLAHTTHYPLTDDNLPLEEYIIQLQKAGYRGIYNLELESGRFWQAVEPRRAFETSIERLKGCLAALEAKKT